MKNRYVAGFLILGFIASSIACQKSSDSSKPAAAPQPVSAEAENIPKMLPALDEELDLQKNQKLIADSSPEQHLKLADLMAGTYEAGKIRITIESKKRTGNDSVGTPALSAASINLIGVKLPPPDAKSDSERSIKHEGNSDSEEFAEIKFMVPETIQLGKTGKLNYQYHQVTVQRQLGKPVLAEISKAKDIQFGSIQPSVTDQKMGVGFLLTQNSGETQLPLGGVVISKRPASSGVKLSYVSKFTRGSDEIFVSAILTLKTATSEDSRAINPRLPKEKVNDEQQGSEIDVDKLRMLLGAGVYMGRNSLGMSCFVNVMLTSNYGYSYYMRVDPPTTRQALTGAFFEMGESSSFQGSISENAATLKVEGRTVVRSLSLKKLTNGDLEIKVSTESFARNYGLANADCVIPRH